MGSEFQLMRKSTRGVLFGALIRSAAGADGTAGGAEIAAILADHRVVATFAT